MELEEPLQTKVGSVLIDNDLFKTSASYKLNLADTACSGPVVSPKYCTQIRRSCRQKLINGTNANLALLNVSNISHSSQILKTRQRRRRFLSEPYNGDSAPYLTVAVRSAIISTAAVQQSNEFAFPAVSAIVNDSLDASDRAILSPQHEKSLCLEDMVVAGAINSKSDSEKSSFSRAACEIEAQTIIAPYTSGTLKEKAHTLATFKSEALSETLGVVVEQLHAGLNGESETHIPALHEDYDTFTQLNAKTCSETIVRCVEAGEKQYTTGSAVHGLSYTDCELGTKVPLSSVQCHFESCLSVPCLSSHNESCAPLSAASITIPAHKQGSTLLCDINVDSDDTVCQCNSTKTSYPELHSLETSMLACGGMSQTKATDVEVKESTLALATAEEEPSYSQPRAYRMRPGTLLVRKATRGQEDAAKNKVLDAKALEDLYCNRLWKNQLPKERTWETIYEEPVFVAKSSSVKVQSVSRVKRLVTFPEEGAGPSPAKMKRRKQRAKQHGWRAFTMKRLQEADTVLHAKIAQLDSSLGEEPYYLPVAENGFVVRHKDGANAFTMTAEPTEY